MERQLPEPVLLVASERELPAAARVWGHGGWLMPAEREALDWLTLLRLMGWGVQVCYAPGVGTSVTSDVQWVIVACEPEELDAEFVNTLSVQLDREPVVVLLRATTGSGTSPLAGFTAGQAETEGHTLAWRGPGTTRTWRTRRPVRARALNAADGTEVWVALDGVPIVAARRRGKGTIITLGFQPSEARDAEGAFTAILRHLLSYGRGAPSAWLDCEHTLILRMDDPGGSQNVFSRSWASRKLAEAEWHLIAADLAGRAARLTVGYTPGWADDGDPQRGDLTVDGVSIKRVPAQVYPSPVVKYRDRAGHLAGSVHDYTSEYRGILALCAAGLGSVEVHGYTHIHPDRLAWASAIDRYEAVRWYRELGKPAAGALAALSAAEHPLALSSAALRQYFGTAPTTLISPGDQWTDAVLAMALNLGLKMVSSYYLALRDHDRFCWAQHVCAPYLDEPADTWFDAGLPVVGYFHDRDLVLNGVEWLSRSLDRWQMTGARRFIDMRELAARLGCRLRMLADNGEWVLRVENRDGLEPVRPIPVAISAPAGGLPDSIILDYGGRRVQVEVAPAGDGHGEVLVPPLPDIG